MKSSEIRRKFLDFFAKKMHAVVASSSLVPRNDPTLLFTNAGMVQFKDVFLGTDQRSYKRAASSQRCIRAGGKHNDLENVGYTARHHTFFEMLGNFSFGDYFKKEAIHFAWEFLTQELKLPKEKLWVTVFEEDHEAATIWINEIGVDPNRLSHIGAKDNFWAMGDTGPCGPCSEIFYDHGAEIWGGPPGSPEEDGDRYIEIWNLVFMQYDRAQDGTLTPLPKPSVDTGMGLERISAIMQGVHNNYDTDLFQPIIRAAAKIAQSTDLENKSLRVIADHLRATAFLIADGVHPLNEGRGYVLRRIMRRAMRHGYKLNMPQSFFHELLPNLIEIMGDAYPELKQRQHEIIAVMKREEEQFARTLEQGMKLLDQAIEIAQHSNKVIAGETVFKLYDTYGFPVDLTADIAREKGLQIDEAGFDREMEKQRELSKSASKFAEGYTAQLSLPNVTLFKGYETINHATQVTGLFLGNTAVHQLAEGEKGTVILEETPFYAESGGQIGDRGLITFEQGEFVVEDTQKAGNAVAHFGHMKRGQLKVNSAVHAQVDEKSRNATALNHSATHLLHAALQQVLGKHVEQKGSLVSPQRLRFDFTHPQAVTAAQLQQIEQIVNQQVRANHIVTTDLMSPDDAVKAGAMALFGEKYGDEVRVLTIGEFSKELCGGTHVNRTGDIGLFKIIEESGIAAGVRRIEAVTGQTALDFIQQSETILRDATILFKANRQNFIEKLHQSQQQQKSLEKNLEILEKEIAKQHVDGLLHQAETHGDKKLLITKLPNADAKQVRQIAELLKDRFGQGGFLLAGTRDDKISLIAVVDQVLAKSLKAGDWINSAAQLVGGKGGGRPDFAQAGGTDVTRLDEALAAAKQFFTDRVNDKCICT